MKIEVDQARCAELSISPLAVEEALKIAGRGVLTPSRQTRILMQRNGTRKSALDSMTLKAGKGDARVPLNQVTKQELLRRRNLNTRNGIPCASIKLVITPGASFNEVMERVEKVISDSQPPEGVTVSIDELRP